MESVGAFGISTSLLGLLFVVFSWPDMVSEVCVDAAVANTVTAGVLGEASGV